MLGKRLVPIEDLALLGIVVDVRAGGSYRRGGSAIDLGCLGLMQHAVFLAQRLASQANTLMLASPEELEPGTFELHLNRLVELGDVRAD